MKTIGVLALQGAVNEHMVQLKRLHINVVNVKKPKQLEQLDGLIIPGGESTAISRLLIENHFIEPIKKLAIDGKGVLGTCAGLVLCAKKTTKPNNADKQTVPLDLIDIIVERNAFGRQKESFETKLDIIHIGQSVPALFIRAPSITYTGANVEVLAKVDNCIVMAQQQNILVTAFHPELTNDLRVMRYFLDLCPSN